MQPNWLKKRKPKQSEAELVALVKRRHGKGVKVLIGENELLRERAIPSPSQEAAGAVERALASLTLFELPDWAEKHLAITLNKLDKLPPLRARATSQERETRNQLPAQRDRLIASVAAVRSAHEAGDVKKAAFAYGAACNIIGWLETLWDLPEVSAGRRNIAGAVKGGRLWARQQAADNAPRRQQIRAYVAEKRRRVPSLNAACRDAARTFGLSPRTIKRYLSKK